MASTTIPARTGHATPPTWRKARAALVSWASQGARVASAARRRYRRPALVISGLACADASAWHTFGIGAGLAVLAGCFFLLEFLGGEDGTP